MSQLDRCIFLDNQNVKYISEDPGLLVLVLWWVLFHYKVKETKIIFINLFHSSASTCIILKVQRWYYYLQISFKTVGIRIYFFSCNSDTFFFQDWQSQRNYKNSNLLSTSNKDRQLPVPSIA